MKCRFQSQIPRGHHLPYLASEGPTALHGRLQRLQLGFPCGRFTWNSHCRGRSTGQFVPDRERDLSAGAEGRGDRNLLRYRDAAGRRWLAGLVRTPGRGPSSSGATWPAQPSCCWPPVTKQSLGSRRSGVGWKTSSRPCLAAARRRPKPPEESRITLVADGHSVPLRPGQGPTGCSRLPKPIPAARQRGDERCPEPSQSKRRNPRP